MQPLFSCSADEDEIREYFQHFGKLESFKIAKNENGRSRGFGFLKFKTTKGTKAALETAHFIHSRPVELRCVRFSSQAPLEFIFFDGKKKI